MGHGTKIQTARKDGRERGKKMESSERDSVSCLTDETEDMTPSGDGNTENKNV